MESFNRKFYRGTLLTATIVAAGMLLGAPAAKVQAADDIDASLVLPPLPDLRTPDQVRWWERWRNRRVSQMRIRNAKAEAKRDAKEKKSRATVNRPVQDPSTAAAVVQSQQGSPYSGTGQAPQTINGGTLTPFNGGSKFFQGGFLVYQGQERRGRR